MQVPKPTPVSSAPPTSKKVAPAEKPTSLLQTQATAATPVLQTPSTPALSEGTVPPGLKDGASPAVRNETHPSVQNEADPAIDQRKNAVALEGKPVQRVGPKKRVKEELTKREKMKEGDTIKSDNFTWKVVKLLGSGGFGDVYKVVKVDNDDKKDYALKTEMCAGDRRVLRLKVEVHVLKLCQNVEKPERKKHFVELVDRGKNEKFKFLVMGLVGQSLEDIRRSTLRRNYSKSTGMQIAYQTLHAVHDLHDLGYLHRNFDEVPLSHRDIKPQNFAIGLETQRNIIYMLDFGIARKFTVGMTKELKAPRLYVKFIGTIRFASRACHNCVEQGRKDDLESWLYMVRNDLFKIRLRPACYEIIPDEYKRLVQYVNCLKFADEPDYIYMIHAIRAIAKENGIDMDGKLDWEMNLDQQKANTVRDIVFFHFAS
uniref:Protein kinase domain-containing protein n=1 Tax=Angiostrongylus cantonensis TaxID=6313 RepID=A0A158P8V3_ANGCA